MQQRARDETRSILNENEHTEATTPETTMEQKPIAPQKTPSMSDSSEDAFGVFQEATEVSHEELYSNAGLYKGR
jgi:hypothetical protein